MLSLETNDGQNPGITSLGLRLGELLGKSTMIINIVMKRTMTILLLKFDILILTQRRWLLDLRLNMTLGAVVLPPFLEMEDHKSQRRW